jgi:hypothetical protein
MYNWTVIFFDKKFPGSPFGLPGKEALHNYQRCDFFSALLGTGSAQRSPSANSALGESRAVDYFTSTIFLISSKVETPFASAAPTAVR